MPSCNLNRRKNRKYDEHDDDQGSADVDYDGDRVGCGAGGAGGFGGAVATMLSAINFNRSTHVNCCPTSRR